MQFNNVFGNIEAEARGIDIQGFAASSPGEFLKQEGKFFFGDADSCILDNNL